MQDLVPILIIILIIFGASFYVYKSKKRGSKCTGCSGCVSSKPTKSAKKSSNCACCCHCLHNDEDKQ